MIYFIKFIHILLIIFLFSSIFISNIKYKKLALSLLIIILLQYFFNDKKCLLTEIEYILQNKKYEHGFIYRLINPIINISDKYIIYFLFIIHIFWIVILHNQIK